MSSIACQHLILNLIFDTSENGEGRQDGYGSHGGRRRVGNSYLTQFFGKGELSVSSMCWRCNGFLIREVSYKNSSTKFSRSLLNKE